VSYPVISTHRYLQVPASTCVTQIRSRYLHYHRYLTCRSGSPVAYDLPKSELVFFKAVNPWVQIRVTHECTRAHPYLPLTTHSLIHMGIGETIAWIVMHLGIIGEEIPSDKTKLGPRSLIHLHNVTLAQLNMGFESPWVLDAIWEYPCHEAGFHIIPIEVHVCTLTQTPHPIPVHFTHVAIPNNLLNLSGASYPIHCCTLGQRFIEGKRNPHFILGS
jgi:hypothetical protein